MVSRLIAAACMVALCSPVLGAQTVRGTVTDRATAATLPGVVVLLVDNAGMVVARTLSDASGTYLMAAPAPGQYRVRTMRIGFRPATSERVTLAAGSEVSQPLVLAGVPFRLDTVRVAGRNACQVRPDSAMATFAVWEQVRTALSGAQVTAGTRALNARVITYDRALEPTRERVVRQGARVRAGLTARPWNSLSADSLRRGGYVVVGLDGSTTYYAPDLTVLLSDQFVEDHCLRLAEKSDATRLGIEFEPTRERRNTPDIEGTVWLDRRSGELREMLFRYVNVTREQGFGRSGGEMEFARMKNGAFVISRWNIRMPQLDTRMVPQPGLRIGGAMQAERFVREVRVEGGELALVVLGRDTLWSRPPLILAGRILDSLSGRGIAGTAVSLRGAALRGETDGTGVFRIADVLPGEYLMDIRTPEYAQLGAVHSVPIQFVDARTEHVMRVPSARMLAKSFCPGGLDGIVAGTLTIAGDSLPPRGVKVVAEWREIRAVASGAARGRNETPTADFLHQNKWTDARSDAQGNYRLCGIPINTAVTIRVEHDSASASPQQLRIGSEELFGRADLTLHRGMTGNAMLTGVVLNAGNGRPLADVEVVVTGVAAPRSTPVNRATYTNEQGAFRLGEIPPGKHQLTVRRVGYKVFQDSIPFSANQGIDRAFVLSAVAELAPVVVEASQLPPSFDAHRALGLGTFFTRADLAKLENRTMAAVFAQVPGVQMIRTLGAKTYLASTRGRQLRSGTGDNVVPPPPACYSNVYLDRTLLYSGREDEPLFDLNSISPDRIEAIEFYPAEMMVPVQYMSHNTKCGVIVIHSRRSK